MPINSLSLNKYTGGYNEIGVLLRKRNKRKEISAKEFNAMNPIDTWRDSSCSWRTYTAQKMLISLRESTALKLKNIPSKINKMEKSDDCLTMKNDYILNSSKKSLCHHKVSNSNTDFSLISPKSLISNLNLITEKDYQRLIANKNKQKIYKKSLESCQSSFGSNSQLPSKLKGKILRKLRFGSDIPSEFITPQA